MKTLILSAILTLSATSAFAARPLTCTTNVDRDPRVGSTDVTIVQEGDQYTASYSSNGGIARTGSARARRSTSPSATRVRKSPSSRTKKKVSSSPSCSSRSAAKTRHADRRSDGPAPRRAGRLPVSRQAENFRPRLPSNLRPGRGLEAVAAPQEHDRRIVFRPLARKLRELVDRLVEAALPVELHRRRECLGELAVHRRDVASSASSS